MRFDLLRLGAAGGSHRALTRWGALLLLFAATPAAAAPRSAIASWYHEGRLNADGSRFDPDGLTAAHRSLPFGTRLRVTRGSRSVVVTIRDRGPALWTGRSLDLSRGAARAIGMLAAGVTKVTYRIEGRAR